MAEQRMRWSPVLVAAALGLGAAACGSAPAVSQGAPARHAAGAAGSAHPTASTPTTGTAPSPVPGSAPATTVAAPPTPTADPPAPVTTGRPTFGYFGSTTTTCDAVSPVVSVTSVVTGTDGRIDVTATPQSYTCGGPDDGHWSPSGSPVTLALAAAATVEVLTSGTAAGIAQSPIPASAFAAFVSSGRQLDPLYQVLGGLDAPTGLSGVYKP